MKKLISGIRRLTRPVASAIYARCLKNKDVAIISNNCWSSYMCQYCKIPYNSPFAGLFMYPDDYLAMLQHPEVMNGEMIFISHSESKHNLSDNSANYPIGVLTGGGSL